MLRDFYDLTFEMAYRKGPIDLTSKQASDYYFDMRNLVMSARGAASLGRVAKQYLKLFFPDVRAVGGLATAAIPIAACIANFSWPHRPLNQFYVRKNPRTHGTCKQVEGHVFPGDSVLIVDDVLTTGGSLEKAITACRDAGLKVEGVLVLVDREENDALQRIQELLPNKHVISLIKRKRFQKLYDGDYRPSSEGPVIPFDDGSRKKLFDKS